MKVEEEGASGKATAPFSSVARSEDVSALREVLAAFVEQGGRVFDTAPSYGASEEVAGQIASELAVAEQIFWAAKLNVAGRGGGAADPIVGRSSSSSSPRPTRL